MKFPRVGVFLLTIFISTASVIITGCSVMQPVGDFFSQRYINTVSYFNTFYNAKRLFDEAVSEVEDTERRHRQQNREGQVELSQQTKQKFNNIIEKCSRLLHQHPTSKYADDAVLMIGKSYYYMRQNVQAERKFLELLAEFPDSRYIPEAQLLLAKTQLRMNKNTEARVALEDLIERLGSGRYHDIIALARIELGNLYKQSGDLEKAIEEFSAATDIARDRTIRTEARFNLANVYYTLDEEDIAYAEYSKVIDDRPTARILFLSQQARARILTKNDRHEEAIDLLDDLLTDLRLVDYISRIELEAAHIYRDKGILDKAIDQYVYVDTTYTRTPVSTEAQYSLANIYKDVFGDFEKAKKYFELVSRATPPSDLTRSAWAINDNLTRYWKHKNDITRLDSVITKNEYLFAEAKIIEHAAEEGETHLSLSEDTTQITEGDVLQTPDNSDTTMQISSDELRSRIATDTGELVRNYYELAGLFLIEMELPDSAAYYYSRLAYNFPESQYAPQALYALAEIVRVADEEGSSIVSADLIVNSRSTGSSYQSRRDIIYELLISDYPDTEFATEAKRILGMEIPQMESDPLEQDYLQAEKAMFEEDYESALKLFSSIAQDTTGSRYSVQACYAIGWIYENIIYKPDSAVVYYKMLMERHPETQYASAVEGKISAWNQKIAEELKESEEEETATDSVVQDEDPIKPTTEEEVDERPVRQRGIPLARPTDILELEEKPDTTRIKKQNEN